MSKTKSNGEKAIDREVCILHCVTMRLTTAECLLYMDAHGYKMGESTYYKHKKDFQAKYQTRADNIMEYELLEQHMKRIDALLTIEHELWTLYNILKAHEPYQASTVLGKLTVVQGYIASAYGVTVHIIGKQKALVKLNEHESSESERLRNVEHTRSK